MAALTDIASSGAASLLKKERSPRQFQRRPVVVAFGNLGEEKSQSQGKFSRNFHKHPLHPLNAIFGREPTLSLDQDNIAILRRKPVYMKNVRTTETFQPPSSLSLTRGITFHSKFAPVGKSLDLSPNGQLPRQGTGFDGLRRSLQRTHTYHGGSGADDHITSVTPREQYSRSTYQHESPMLKRRGSRWSEHDDKLHDVQSQHRSRTSSKLDEEERRMLLASVKQRPDWPPGYGLEKFRRAVRMVSILVRWISLLKEKEGFLDSKTFTDLEIEVKKLETKASSNYSFDASRFRADKEIQITTEARHTLNIPAAVRTQEQVQHVMYGLRSIESFAEYPLDVQEKLCKAGWFQEVPARRIIIRQGHQAESFYFMLSGQAFVRVLDEYSVGQMKTINILKKGSSFGEAALLHGATRNATIVTRTPVQLLAINKNDFFNIFLEHGDSDTLPRHVEFLREIPFLEDWPISLLLSNKELCVCHFFKRGTLIVSDSKTTDWIYIIKRGSCNVLKRLKAVKPRSKTKPGKSEHHTPDQDLLPTLMEGLTPKAKPRISTGRVVSLPQIEIHPEIISARSNLQKHLLQEQLNNKQKKTKLDDEDQGPVAENGFSKSKFVKFSANFNSPHMRSTSSSTGRHRSAPEQGERHNNKQKQPVFVLLQTLEPKDVFGLDYLAFSHEIHDEGPSVALVSNGAECVMLNKSLFLKHVQESTQRLVRNTTRPFPSEDVLQISLQTHVDWCHFRDIMFKETAEKLCLRNFVDT